MSRNKTLILILASAFLLTAIVASLTEYRDVSAYEWNDRYNFEDEQPLGLYIFKEVANRFFNEVPIDINAELEDTLDTKSLYIQFVPEDMDEDVMDSLISIASLGNDVLIIGNTFNDQLADTIPHFFETMYLVDSTLTFNFTANKIASDSNYIYEFHNKEFDQSVEESIYLLRGLNWEDDQQFIEVATPDSLALMISFPIGDGRIFYHVQTDLFYNYSYRQPEMFDYTQRLFSHFDPKHIYLLNPLTIYGAGNFKNRNPLNFIMSQPALKAAYYLLILGALLFVFFGGKRKQKIIPVMEKNENTSLEYIETVSQLFYQQEQHEKLIAHMKNIFFHKMQKKYFIAPDDPNYVQVLSKKSKISTTELQYIVDRFQNLDNHFSFSGEQLISLNRRLEAIYKEIEMNRNIID